MIFIEVADAIEQLVLRWAWLLDHGPQSEIPQLFTDDGVYEFAGEFIVRGRPALLSRYKAREMRKVTSRHVVSNWQLDERPDGSMRGRGILTVYRHEGTTGAHSIPLGVIDVEDRYVLDDHAQWLIASRTLTAVFRRESEQR